VAHGAGRRCHYDSLNCVPTAAAAAAVMLSGIIYLVPHPARDITQIKHRSALSVPLSPLCGKRGGRKTAVWQFG